MLRSVPRWKKHELMLLWCRTPMGMGLVRKIGSRAWAKVSGVGARLGRVLGVSKGTPSRTERETWLSWFVGQLIDENVRRVLIVGDTGNDGVTDAVVERIRSGDCPIEVVCHNGSASGLPELADFSAFDCIVIRNSALFTEVGLDAVSSARVLAVCETESFHGYQIVSKVLSGSHWELIGSHGDVWDGCVVCRKLDESPSRGEWEVLDRLHRSE
jgi:hypothetical protein